MSAPLLHAVIAMAARAAVEPHREPYNPPTGEWPATYQMLCGFCAKQLKCSITEAMIAMKDGGPWPFGGFVTDPGAGVTCLSYEPKIIQPLPRQQMRQMLRLREGDLPPMCGGCAAQKGSEASVSLHTLRDYRAAVRNGTPFNCHESSKNTKLCGGWCRAVRNRRERGAA